MAGCPLVCFILINKDKTFRYGLDFFTNFFRFKDSRVGPDDNFYFLSIFLLPLLVVGNSVSESVMDDSSGQI